MTDNYEKAMDLKAMVPGLRKELELIEKNLFNCYLKPETVFVPLSSIRDMLTAFVVPGSVYQRLLENNKGRDSELCPLNEIIATIKRHLIDVESPHRLVNMHDWVDGLPFIAKNRIFVKSLKNRA